MPQNLAKVAAAAELAGATPAPITEAEARAARLHPRVLAQDYLFADLRNLIAAGGTGKTTLLLFESVMGALGRPIWGREVPQPFTTAFVTKEDPREILVARLSRILDSIGATDAEREQAWRRIWPVELVGTPFRLSKAEDRALSPDTTNLMALVGHLENVRPDRVIFDPLISFTHGEANVNDSEQAVVEAARFLMQQWPNALIEVVHHTGKANGRAETTDQYSGRNGSALPDGSRMVAVLVKRNVDQFYEATGMRLDPTEDVGLRMALPKMSYAPPQPDIYIRRVGYNFQVVPTLTAQEQAAIKEERRLIDQAATGQATRDSIVAVLHCCAVAEDASERYPSRSALLAMPGVVGANASRAEALRDLIAAGAVEEVKLTADDREQFASPRVLGGRKTYLRLVQD